MKAAPFFVFALMAGKLVEMAGTTPLRAGVFAGWVGILSQLFGPCWSLSSSAIVRLIHPRWATRDLQVHRPAQFLAFSTMCGALPSMEVVNDHLKIPKKISSFVLPTGATVNMDGTSFYQAVAVVFLAQFHLIDLSLAQQATIVLMATLASIGSAAVPSAGLIMLIIVLDSVGLNPAWIALIFPVDRPLDMCRTVVNVTGDITVTTAVAASEGALEKA